MKKLVSIICLLFMSIPIAFAYSGDISINPEVVNFSANRFLEGNPIRIYATATNNSDNDLLGVVKFYVDGAQANTDQAISLFAHKTDDVFIDWTPVSWGSKQITITIFPWDPDIDDPANNSVSRNIFVEQDTDHDGLTNTEDPDDDNDGVPDNEDHFPLDASEQYDTDGDGIGDNADPDADNDGTPDTEDDLPLDPNETMDTDGDGIGNIEDDDDDGDGLSDDEEENSGTNPLYPDSDDDGVEDGSDDFPLNPDEQYDTDNDGIGNNIDIDDDGDGIPDDQDEFPLNKAPIIELEDDALTIGLLEKHTFDASPSYDDDGEIISYIWEIGGIIVEGNAITHIFNKIGEYSVKLTVTDDSGQSVTQEFMVSVMNSRFYWQIFATLAALLLAIIIFLKYIAPAKKQDKKKK